MCVVPTEFQVSDFLSFHVEESIPFPMPKRSENIKCISQYQTKEKPNVSLIYSMTDF